VPLSFNGASSTIDQKYSWKKRKACGDQLKS
jgi:hypothetical protein